MCRFVSIYYYANTIICSILGARYFFIFLIYIVTCSPFNHVQIFTLEPTSLYLCYASDESLVWKNFIRRDKSVRTGSHPLSHFFFPFLWAHATLYISKRLSIYQWVDKIKWNVNNIDTVCVRKFSHTRKNEYRWFLHLKEIN